MDKIYLKNELVTGDTLTPEGVLTYIALRKIMDESAAIRGKDSTQDCISVNKMAYSLIGTMEKYDKSLLDALVRGVYELVAGNILTIIQSYQNEWVLDFKNMYVDTMTDKYTVIIANETKKILTINGQMKRNISMLKYFVALVSTFDWSASLKCKGNMPDLQGKLTHMPQDYIAGQAGISVKTCRRYNDILVDCKVIYIYKSNDKIKFDDSLKQINNCYSRYEDRELCRIYASNYENVMGYQHKIVQTKKNKQQADNNRRLAQIYNRIREGYADEYDKATIKEVYKYVTNRNKSLQEKIDEKHSQNYLSYSDQEWVEKLESQIRDTSIFEQFDFLKSVPKVSEGTDETGDWGEPDPLIDFSLEEMLDMNDLSNDKNCHLIGEVQPDPTPKVTDCDLQSEGVSESCGITNSDRQKSENPKMDNEQFLVNLPTTDKDDLEFIDIDSLFDDEEDDKPVLLEDEACELFS